MNQGGKIWHEIFLRHKNQIQSAQETEEGKKKLFYVKAYLKNLCHTNNIEAECWKIFIVLVDSTIIGRQAVWHSIRFQQAWRWIFFFRLMRKEDLVKELYDFYEDNDLFRCGLDTITSHLRFSKIFNRCSSFKTEGQILLASGFLLTPRFGSAIKKKKKSKK